MLCEGHFVEFSAARPTWYSGSVIGDFTKWVRVRIRVHGCLFVYVSAAKIGLLWLRFCDWARSDPSFWRVGHSCWRPLAERIRIHVVIVLLVLIAKSATSIGVLHRRLLPTILPVAITDIPAQHGRPLLRLI